VDTTRIPPGQTARSHSPPVLASDPLHSLATFTTRTKANWIGHEKRHPSTRPRTRYSPRPWIDARPPARTYCGSLNRMWRGKRFICRYWSPDLKSRSVSRSRDEWLDRERGCRIERCENDSFHNQPLSGGRLIRVKCFLESLRRRLIARGRSEAIIVARGRQGSGTGRNGMGFNRCNCNSKHWLKADISLFGCQEILQVVFFLQRNSGDTLRK